MSLPTLLLGHKYKNWLHYIAPQFEPCNKK